MNEFDKDVIDSLLKKNQSDKEDDNSSKLKSNSQTEDFIVLIVDRSGSMHSIKNDAEGGINHLIEEQQKINSGNSIFSLIQFDHDYEVVCDQVPLNEVKPYKLNPRGSTALIDAIGRTLSPLIDYEASGSKIVVIVTDGQENCSREWSRKNVFDAIEKMKEKGWDFMFLGANQDAIAESASLGIDAAASINYSTDSIGVNAVYDAASSYLMAHRTTYGSTADKVLKARKGLRSSISSSSLASSNAHLTEDNPTDDPTEESA